MEKNKLKVLMIATMLGAGSAYAETSQLGDGIFVVSDTLSTGLWSATGELSLMLEDQIVSKAQEHCRGKGKAIRISNFLFSDYYDGGSYTAASSAHFVCK